ncbi:MAG: aminotransferase class V-fold PLP-dependent enzyme [Paraglaciecola sp.]|uniref:aminotransferase class V-fold PLP-dependent enzyme n=1 Tax=Paraglaciecola sp. TaxID=1920173 RepID=UPI00329A3C63
MSHSPIVSRRSVLTGLAAGIAVISTKGLAQSTKNMPSIPENTSAHSLASDEKFWQEIANYYDRTQGIINLEHGYWGKMAKPVQDAYIKATKMVNQQNSFYARKDFYGDVKHAIERVSQALGTEDGEIILTRNATEAVHNLIRQYQGLKPNDAILIADVDYPSFKTAMQWLEQDQAVQPVEIVLPTFANQQQIKQLYFNAFDANPNLKLMLITHVSNQHGLIIPVKEVVNEAKKRGIDVICDCAQSWGLIDYKINDLNVDWAGFNLHKWIGSPVGVGALYMRRGSLGKIAPYPGEKDPDNNKAYTRIHTATSNFAAMLAIPAALDFHQAIGEQNKQERLKYLRNIWFSEAQNLSHIEVLGGKDNASATGMSSFRLAGKTSIAEVQQLQQKLEHDFGIFTVIRKGLYSGACIRITPQVFNRADDLLQLIQALKKIR